MVGGVLSARAVTGVYALMATGVPTSATVSAPRWCSPRRMHLRSSMSAGIGGPRKWVSWACRVIPCPHPELSRSPRCTTPPGPTRASTTGGAHPTDRLCSLLLGDVLHLHPECGLQHLFPGILTAGHGGINTV